MKFSEILEEYLEEWDRQHSDYYDNKMIGSSRNGRERMEELAKEMDTMFYTFRGEY